MIIQESCDSWTGEIKFSGITEDASPFEIMVANSILHFAGDAIGTLFTFKHGEERKTIFNAMGLLVGRFKEETIEMVEEILTRHSWSLPSQAEEVFGENLVESFIGTLRDGADYQAVASVIPQPVREALEMFSADEDEDDEDLDSLFGEE